MTRPPPESRQPPGCLLALRRAAALTRAERVAETSRRGHLFCSKTRDAGEWSGARWTEVGKDSGTGNREWRTNKQTAEKAPVTFHLFGFIETFGKVCACSFSASLSCSHTHCLFLCLFCPFFTPFVEVTKWKFLSKPYMEYDSRFSNNGSNRVLISVSWFNIEC